MYIAPKSFGSNLVFLRNRKGVSQTDIALQLNKGHTTIGNWEKGKNYPTIEDAIIISQYFDVPLNNLLLTDLQNAGESQKSETLKIIKKDGEDEGKHAGFIQNNTDGGMLATSLMGIDNYRESIGTVFDFSDTNSDELTFYIKNYEALKAEEYLRLPELGKGFHIRFLILNDNMNPTVKYGDKVVCTYLPEPATTLREGHIYLFIDKDDGLVCRRLYKAINDNYELRSDNQIYKPYQRSLNDITAVFKVVEVHTRHLGNLNSKIGFELPEET